MVKPVKNILGSFYVGGVADSYGDIDPALFLGCYIGDNIVGQVSVGDCDLFVVYGYKGCVDKTDIMNGTFYALAYDIVIITRIRMPPAKFARLPWRDRPIARVAEPNRARIEAEGIPIFSSAIKMVMA